MFEKNIRKFFSKKFIQFSNDNNDYGIYVIEQNAKFKFISAKLMNIGFVESLNQYDYQCFIFHDVDLIPEDNRNMYTYPEPDQPRHLCCN